MFQMKKYLLVPAGILFLFTVTNCYADKTVNLHMAVKEIKYASNLSGVERMTAMQKYVCQLSEAQLIPLMERIGAERLLVDAHGKNRIRTYNHATNLSHLPEKTKSASSQAGNSFCIQQFALQNIKRTHVNELPNTS